MTSRVTTERLYYGWLIVAACFIIGFVTHGIRYSFGIFFKSLETDLSLSRALTSDIFSVYMVLSSLFAIIGGWVLDRYSPRAIVATMGFFIGISLLLSSQASTLWHLFLTYSLLLAIGTGPAYITIMSVTSGWFIKRRGLALGIVSCGISIGITGMSPIAAWLIVNFAWQTSYFVIALVAFFIMTPVALLLRKAPGEIAAITQDEKLDSTEASNYYERRNSRLDGLSLLQATKTKAFCLLLLAQFLIAFCVFIIVTHIVPHAIDLGITSVKAASILGLIGGMSIPGTLLMGRVSDSIGRRQSIVICVLLMGAAMICLIVIPNAWILYLFAAIFGFARGGTSPPTAALIGDSFGLRRIGIIMALTNVGWSLGAAVGPAFAGYIFDIDGSYIIAFLASLAALLTAATLILFIRTPVAKTKADATW